MPDDHDLDTYQNLVTKVVNRTRTHYMNGILIYAAGVVMDVFVIKHSTLVYVFVGVCTLGALICLNAWLGLRPGSRRDQFLRDPALITRVDPWPRASKAPQQLHVYGARGTKPALLRIGTVDMPRMTKLLREVAPNAAINL